MQCSHGYSMFIEKGTSVGKTSDDPDPNKSAGLAIIHAMIGEEGAAWVGVVFDSRQRHACTGTSYTQLRDRHRVHGRIQAQRVGEEKRGGSSSLLTEVQETAGGRERVEGREREASRRLR